MNVADWLRTLGLERYEAAFRENDVSAEELCHLTAEDLEGLGVSAIGHRRRLLVAIAKLRDDAASPQPVRPTTDDHLASISAAERRPLSVMFCDLIGSTALSARLDPEDLREVIRAYQIRVATTTQQFDGFIARYVGDGVLIYFGWPEAHETDAARAVRAGLAVAAAVSEPPVAGQTLQVRIGIATGLVVIGEPIGAGDSRQQTAVGETPNLAARLQGLAGPNQVIIDAATRRQIGGLFDCRDLGTIELKGLLAVPAWQVVAENRSLGQFEALRSGLTPLVGRDEEIELLLRRWTQAKAGSGRLVLIAAEPGVGKSRLAEVLAERVVAEPHIRLRYFCSPHHQDSALYPVIAQMERAAGFAHGDQPDIRLAKLQALLAATDPPSEDVALLAELHGLLSSDLAALQDFTPQRRKEKTFEALRRQLASLAQQQPVLMVFDDIHWIDPSSRDLLDRLIEQVTNWPVLLLVLFRPEFQPPWIGQPQVSLLTLARLDRRDTVAMVANVAGDAALSPEMVAEIADRTDGVPLFIEELTKVVLEAGAQGSAALSAILHTKLSVPATLHASLMARLDRLGPAAKEIAQIGAAFGRNFAYQPLAAVASNNDGLDEALNRLVDAGLIFSRGTEPEVTYTFKHALVQDAAYGSLLRSSVKGLHTRIASVLEKEFPEIGESKPEVLAHHHAEAGEYILAVDYYLRAGRRALERSANIEASAHFRRGLDALNQLPVDTTRLEYEFQLQTALGPALMPTKGWGAPEVEQAYARARELCHQLGSAPQLFVALRGLWEYYELRANTGAATEIAEEILSLAERTADRALRVIAHDVMGDNALWIGDFSASYAHTTKGIALYDPEQDRAIAYAHGGYDPAMACRAFGAHALWYLGHPDRALKQSQDAVTFARALSHPASLIQALSHAVWHRIFRCQPGVAREQAQAALDLSTQLESQFWMAHTAISLGWAVARTGHPDEGIVQIRRGIAAYKATGAELERTFWLAILADALLERGSLDEAGVVLSEAFSESQTTGVRFHLAELHRLQGEVFLGRSDGSPEYAEPCFNRALQIARDQKAKSLELRAAISLARLWRDQGKLAEARDLLGPIYNWFTEGFDAPDLKDAKAVLEQLTS